MVYQIDSSISKEQKEHYEALIQKLAFPFLGTAASAEKLCEQLLFEEKRISIEDPNLQTLLNVYDESLTQPFVKNVIFAKLAEFYRSIIVEGSITLFELTVSKLCAWLYYTLKEENITWLDLSLRSLYLFTDWEWAALWEGIKDSKVTFLSLADNRLFAITDSQWRIFWGGIKESKISSLNLSSNLLNTLTDSRWRIFWEGIKESKVIFLSLKDNHLNELTDSQWMFFWEGIEESKITSLSLAVNHLNELTDSQWILFWEGIKESKISSPNLSSNLLNTLTDSRWRIFWEGIKESKITSLSLAVNNLNKLTDSQWKVFCEGLAASNVVSLDVSKNNLSTEWLEELQKILEQNKRRFVIKQGIEEYGLKTLCLQRFWKLPNVKLNYVELGHSSAEYTLPQKPGIIRQEGIPKEIAEAMQMMKEEQNKFGLKH